MSTNEDDPNRPEADKLVAETIERYRHLLPPEALSDLKEGLEAFAHTHPEMRAMIDRLRERKAPGRSDVKGKEGAAGAKAPRVSGRKAR